MKFTLWKDEQPNSYTLTQGELAEDDKWFVEGSTVIHEFEADSHEAAQRIKDKFLGWK